MVQQQVSAVFIAESNTLLVVKFIGQAESDDNEILLVAYLKHCRSQNYLLQEVSAINHKTVFNAKWVCSKIIGSRLFRLEEPLGGLWSSLLLQAGSGSAVRSDLAAEGVSSSVLNILKGERCIASMRNLCPYLAACPQGKTLFVTSTWNLLCSTSVLSHPFAAHLSRGSTFFSCSCRNTLLVGIMQFSLSNTPSLNSNIEKYGDVLTHLLFFLPEVISEKESLLLEENSNFH